MSLDMVWFDFLGLFYVIVVQKDKINNEIEEWVQVGS